MSTNASSGGQPLQQAAGAPHISTDASNNATAVPSPLGSPLRLGPQLSFKKGLEASKENPTAATEVVNAMRSPPTVSYRDRVAQMANAESNAAAAAAALT